MGIKIQERWIREVWKHYPCFWIVWQWARASMVVKALHACRSGVPAWSTSLLVVSGGLLTVE
jgi:hypothetical protein